MAILTRDDKGDGPGDGGEPNTYGLPEGEAVARELRRWFNRQRRAVLDAIPDSGPLPERFPDLTDADWVDPMAAAMTPLIGGYWDESGKEVYSRLGLDPETWQVTNPHLAPQIARQSFTFSASTNASTTKSLDRALEQLRDAFTAGLVTEGETLPQLTARVGEIFEGLTKSKARMIAATEASRAVHAAQLQADVDSEVVAGLELLLSADACPLCRKVATEAKHVLLGHPFAVIGVHPEYSTIRHPPIHPHCQCTAIEVLKPEYGGPSHVDWATPLDQPQKGLKDGYTPPPGKVEPKPEPKKAANPPRPTKPPPAKPAPLPPLPEPPPTVQVVPVPVAKPGELIPAKAATPIERAVAFAKARGIEIRPHEGALFRRLYGPLKSARVQAAYDSGTKRIELNDLSEYWADPRKFMAEAAKSRWFSGDSEDHVIVHEVGHALHDRADPARYQEVRKLKLTASQKRLVEEHVSKYGATKPVEFVAEAYAGMVAGKVYNDEVMVLYGYFGGPLP